MPFLNIFIFFYLILDEIHAHSLKVTSLDLGQTGRVLVTGGQDRNVNLWAFGNEKCFMVSFFFSICSSFTSCR